MLLMGSDYYKNHLSHQLYLRVNLFCHETFVFAEDIIQDFHVAGESFLIDRQEPHQHCAAEYHGR
jgi:hypothetical protein